MKSYLFCFILESATVRSEIEVVLRGENDVQVAIDDLTVVDFTMLYLELYVVCLAFFFLYHAVVIAVLRFIVGY